jgi:serine/threonine-protein kinase
MGSVWLAQRLTNQAAVAIKLIDPDFLGSKEAISRFRREAQAAEAIRSTHVVQILDYDVDNGTPFIVMELLKGEDLSKRLRREGMLTPEQTAIILGQVAKAIALAHDHDIVHRDLKPENVFIVREHDDEVVKVLDFGVARHHTALADSVGLHTKTGMVVGTPYYMSPEQAMASEASHLADVWSFGVIAFECITGKRAFHGDSFLEVGTAICKEPMPVPSTIAPVPEGFDAWFAQASARKPSERFQSIRAAAEALRTVCGLVSVRPSAASGLSQQGTALAYLNAQPKTQVVDIGKSAAVNLQGTAAPASRSIVGVSTSPRRRKWPMLVSAAAIVIVGLAVSVHHMSRAGKTVSSASAAGLPSNESATVLPRALSVPPKTIEAPTTKESGQANALTSGDAGVVQLVSDKPERQQVAAPSGPQRAGAGASVAPRPAPTATASSAPKKKVYQPEF